MRITRPSLRALVVCLAGAGMLATGAAATEPVGDQFRVSNQLPAGDKNFDALSPAVAHNTTRNEYLVTWQGETATDNEAEIYGRIMQADGTPRGPDFKISDQGPATDTRYQAKSPAAAYNPDKDEYYVVWAGSASASGAGLGIDQENEIYGKRLSAAGVDLNGGQLRLSTMGPAGSKVYDASHPGIAYNTATKEYMAVWSGNDSVAGTGGLIKTFGEQEIFRQRVSADGLEIADDTQITNIGPAGDVDFDAFSPDIAYNPNDDEFLVSFTARDTVPGPINVHAQLLNSVGGEIGPDDAQLSTTPGDPTGYSASQSSVAHNSATNEYLVAWHDNRNIRFPFGGKYEVHVQRVNADGAEVGSDDAKVSDAGGDHLFDAFRTDVAYDPTANEYMVAWHGGNEGGGLAAGKWEIYTQRLDAAGSQVGPDDVLISSSGPKNDAGFDARSAAIAYGPADKEFFVAWSGASDVAPQVEGEHEIFGRRVRGAAGVDPVGPPPPPPPGVSEAQCATASVVTGGGASGTLKLTAGQLKINQKIGQAAVRRANAIQGWLDAGLVNGDICGGSLVSTQLDPGVSTAQGPLGPVPATADPRNLSIPGATPKPGVTFELTAEQLQINQNVYSAAVRRANALKARIEGELTGGDIKDDELTGDRLRQDLSISALAPAATIASASTTKVKPAVVKNAVFTPTLKQLRINQKVAQAAVKRTNELRAMLGTGFTGENFADGSISAVDWK